MKEAAAGLLAEGSSERAVVAGTPAGKYPDPGAAVVHRGDPLDVFMAADVALAKSGTTTLECALANVPMVVGYRAHWSSYWIVKLVAEVKYAALPNLILDRAAFPELLQHACTTEALLKAVRPLLDPATPEARGQREALDEVRMKVGGPGAAGRVAEIAAGLVGA